ncbi:phosphate ABC transporter permease PstA [Synoicihabitans lomoniglobus]|uniref:Phosphate transport system permease protein PstA n=1 Tax=Synoicihabitans lomoniglobus TaxID=2909285 RepID=A0AAF0CQB8_9BACT|nr:phosphate ABC transporter permease PstA [Opitutaceae bacterium LMO-M01]WED66115.1 phosphate ABC transporter permease PstA [Opitutaceae bacterium LMO-M01]
MSEPSKHLFAHRPSPRHRAEQGIALVFRLATYIILAAGLAVFGDIVIKGSRTVFQSSFPFVNVAFLTEAPQTLYVFDYEGEKMELSDSEYREFRTDLEAQAAATGEAAPDLKPKTYVYSAGGIFPNIVGTILLVVGSMTIALVLGVASAVYLNEYAKQGVMVRFIRLAILNLAGVPSIVFGLFGFGMFVIFFGWNVSLMAGWFTLAFMVLPVVITASEESLKAVPMGFREGSLALGATKWQTIRKAVLPYATPGILTSSILGIARVAGETAPIMFTAAYVVRDKLPWQVEKAMDFFFQGVMALPYHIYVVSSKIPQNEYSERVQYGTAFVFLGIVALIATSSIILRNRLRARYRW